MKKENKFRNMRKAIAMELREHKSSFMVYAILRLLVIVVLILQVFNGNYENVFLCALTLLLLIIPSFLQVNLKIELPTTLEIFMLLFIFSAEILGEIREFYIIFPFWDTLLHTINGFLAAAIGFALVDILNKRERSTFQLSPVFMAIVAFCFSMTIGVLWEFFEYGMDMIFRLDMQKDTILHTISTVMLDPAGGNKPVIIKNISDVMVNDISFGLGGYLDIGLLDTMKDLIVNFVGAVIFSVIGFFYVKQRGKGKFAGNFIPRLKKKDADYLEMTKENKESKLKKENKEQMEESEITTIIFDIGNVLVDFDFEKCFKKSIRDKVNYEKVKKATVDSNIWGEFDRGVWSDDAILEAFIKNDVSVKAEIQEVFDHLDGIIKKRDFVIPWIKQLKEKGYQVLVLSNFPKRTYDMNKVVMDELMAEVDGGILSYQVKAIKPNVSIYRMLLEKYHLNAETCIFLDDTEKNLVTARKLGMKVIHYIGKKEAMEEFEKFGI